MSTDSLAIALQTLLSGGSAKPHTWKKKRVLGKCCDGGLGCVGRWGSRKGLFEQAECNLISKWVVGTGLPKARKGLPGRKEQQEERAQGRRGSGRQSLNPKEGGTLWARIAELVGEQC